MYMGHAGEPPDQSESTPHESREGRGTSYYDGWEEVGKSLKFRYNNLRAIIIFICDDRV